MITAKKLQANLAHCIGSTTVYKHPFGIRFTEGIKLLADEAQCTWLMDAISSHQKCYQII